MPKFNYVAMDQKGKEQKGVLEVASQNEAIGRVKEMGLFPTKIVAVEKEKEKPGKKASTPAPGGKPAKKKGKMEVNLNIKIPFLRDRKSTRLNSSH